MGVSCGSIKCVSLTPGILDVMLLSEVLNWPLPAGVNALCSTRQGGVSLPPFDSWNLGDHVGDNPMAVANNRQHLQAQLGSARAVFLKQVHGVDVVQLTPETMDGSAADACVTTRSHLACTIMVADCLPILLTDDQGRAVAAAHAGWRGLSSGVIEQTVHALCGQAQVGAASLRVWLGPCIGPMAFEVGAEVREAFVKPDASASAYFLPHPTHPNKWVANLSGLARHRLKALGVRSISGNDGSLAWCTVAQSSRFFSYRRDGATGRFAACIWLSA